MKGILKFSRITIVLIILLIMASNARSQYIVNGSAYSNGPDCFVLTPDAGSRGGSVWSENMISLHQDFDVTFQVFLGYNDYGADGIAFVLQPVGTGITGGIGGGLGYFGISPSIAVEYDTYQNDDPALDHISIQLNGDVNLSGTLAGPVQASASVVNIEDGMWHSTRIVWNAGTKTMTVFFDDTFRLDYQDDIVANIFGGNSDVYWGFTGATGGAANLQQFCITSLSFGEASAIPLSPWMILVVITMIVAVTLIRYKKSI